MNYALIHEYRGVRPVCPYPLTWRLLIMPQKHYVYFSIITALHYMLKYQRASYY